MQWASELTILGGILLSALGAEYLGRKTPFPRVTLLILLGVAIGPSGLSVLPVDVEAWHTLFSDIALLMIGFLLGGKLSRARLRETGRQVAWISVFEVLGVVVLVFGGLLALGAPPAVALILAGIGPASAPAAVTSVVQELKARGRFSDTLLGVVAIDDAWGLVLFSFLLAAAQVLAGGATGAAGILLDGGRELGGAVLLGLALGLPAAFLTGRLRPGEPTRVEALGIVLLCGGLALGAQVSFILASMIAGATVANLARHHSRPFHEIENIEWPFMAIFFVLAGASLNIGALAGIGAMGLAYVLLRMAGLVGGAWLGALIGGAPPAIRRWMGVAILPQAGVALGMALIAGQKFPEYRDMILTLVIGSTVIFELIGPIATALALRRAGEARAG